MDNSELLSIDEAVKALAGTLPLSREAITDKARVLINKLSDEDRKVLKSHGEEGLDYFTRDEREFAQYDSTTEDILWTAGGLIALTFGRTDT